MTSPLAGIDSFDLLVCLVNAEMIAVFEILCLLGKQKLVVDTHSHLLLYF